MYIYEENHCIKLHQPHIKETPTCEGWKEWFEYRFSVRISLMYSKENDTTSGVLRNH